MHTADFAEYLIKSRGILGISQTALGQQMGIAGSTISKWESKTGSPPRPYNIEKARMVIARLLDEKKNPPKVVHQDTKVLNTLLKLDFITQDQIDAARLLAA